MNQRVAVVGAGASGLVAARMLRDEGLEVAVFERAERLGGVWVLEPPDSKQPTAMYEHLTTNLPGALMAYSDLPFPLRTPMFPPHREVLRYLESYAAAFDLAPLLRLGTEVLDARWDAEASAWRVVSRRADGVEESQEFHKLAVCNGHYSCPFMPELPGADEFPGPVLHSFDFHDAAAYAGKRVLILGASASAFDIADMLLRCAPGGSVAVSSRSPPTPPGRLLSRAPIQRGATIVGGLLRLTSSGSALLCAADKEWGPAAAGERELVVDAVICATGYRYTFPFLRSCGLEEKLCGDGTSMRHLYKRVFYTANPSLALIGTPNVLIPPWLLFEFQARWLAKVWSGRRSLPAEAEREAEAATRHVPQPAGFAHRDNLGFGTAAYCNDLAALSGAEGYYSLLLRSKLWRMLAAGLFGHPAASARL